MSIEVMTAVWDYSTAYGGDLVMMLAIANYADINGRAYPSVKTLAQRGRMTERNTQYCIKKLEALGELKVEKNAGPHGTHVFQIILQGANFSGCKVFTHQKKRKRNKELTHKGEKIAGEKIAGVQSFQTETHFTGGVKPISPEPSLDPSVKEKDLTPDTADAVSTPSNDTKPSHRRKTPQQNIVPEWSEDLSWSHPLSLMALYHALKPDDWSAIEIVTEARLKKCRDYLAQFPQREFWEGVFSKLHEPSWLRDNLAPQHRSLDWLLQKGFKDGIENCVKVAERNYTKNHSRASPSREPGSETVPSGCIGFNWRDGKGRYCDACHATHFPVGR